MSRIACFAAAVAVAALMAPDVASAQSDPSAPRPRARAAGAPPPPAIREAPGAPGVFTTEEKRANTYQTYPRGSSGCIEDLGYGRIKYGCD
jgi:hypothetical protein